jgi:hypothetical protein
MASNSFKVKNSLNLTPQASEPSGLEVGDLWADLNGKIYRYDGSGSKEIGSSQGGINYITNPDFESNATGWNTYKDAAQAVVVDGTAGTPTGLTIARSTSSPLRGTASGLIAKTASASRQGEGASIDFSIDSADQAKVLEVSFDYTVTANYVDGDIRVYVYDVTNATVIELSQRDLLANSGQATYRGFFQAAANSTSYRLIYHVATSTTLAYDIKIDNVKVGPAQAIESGNVVVMRASSATTSFSTTTTIVFPTILADTSGAYNAASGIYTIPESGYYLASACFRTTSITLTTTQAISLLFDLDGSTLAAATTQGTGGANAYRVDGSSGVFYANKGQQLKINGFSNATATGSGVASDNYFTIAKIASDQASAGSSVVAFEAFRSSVENYAPNNSFVKVNPNATTLNTTGSYNTANSRFEAPDSGVYAFTANLFIASTNVLNSRYRPAFYKNGSIYSTGNYLAPTSSLAFCLTHSDVIYLNKGDTVELYIFGSGNNSTNQLESLTGSANLRFCGYKISSPAIIPPTEFVGCSYSTNAGQSIANSGDVTVLFEDIDYDSTGSYNVANGIWTCPVAGKYDLKSCNLFVTTTSFNGTSEFVYCSIFKNGTLNTVSDYNLPATANANYGSMVNATLDLVKGDQITFRVFQSSGGPLSLLTNGVYNKMSITKVG